MLDRHALLLAKLEKQKADLLLEIGTWPLAKVRYQPSPREWSALQILDHLLKTEVAIREAARKGLVQPHRIGLTDRLRTRFLHSVFQSDRRVKVPSSASQVLPGSDPDLQTMIEQWQKSRGALQHLAQNVTEEQQTKGIFRHPVGGWMGLSEILDFFSVHLTHHSYQLARLKEAFRTSHLEKN